MILNFAENVDEIEKIVGKPVDRMAVSMVLATILDRGIAMERKRVIAILQRNRNVINVRDVVAEINKPLR